MGKLEDERPGPYSSPLLYPLPDSSSQLYEEEGSGQGVGELPLLDDDEEVPTLWTIPLVLGMAELEGFLSLLSLCFDLIALNLN